MDIDVNDLQKLRNKVEGELYNTDPIVRKSLELHNHGDIPYENALLVAIIYLSKQSKFYEGEMVKYMTRSSSPIKI